jgi:hypothetical protein
MIPVYPFQTAVPSIFSPRAAAEARPLHFLPQLPYWSHLAPPRGPGTDWWTPDAQYRHDGVVPAGRRRARPRFRAQIGA